MLQSLWTCLQQFNIFNIHQPTPRGIPFPLELPLENSDNDSIDLGLPSGNLLHSYWKWPGIVSFPIKNGDFP